MSNQVKSKKINGKPGDPLREARRMGFNDVIRDWSPGLGCPFSQAYDTLGSETSKPSRGALQRCYERGRRQAVLLLTQFPDAPRRPWSGCDQMITHLVKVVGPKGRDAYIVEAIRPDDVYNFTPWGANALAANA